MFSYPTYKIQRIPSKILLTLINSEKKSCTLWKWSYCLYHSLHVQINSTILLPIHVGITATKSTQENDHIWQDWCRTSSLTPTFKFCHGRNLNPIEHLWDHLDQQIRSRPVLPVNLQDLEQCLLDEWQHITPNVIRRLMTSIHRCVSAYIDAQGGHTCTNVHWRLAMGHFKLSSLLTVLMKCSFFDPTHLNVLVLMTVPNWWNRFCVHMLLKGFSNEIYQSKISILIWFHCMSLQTRGIVLLDTSFRYVCIIGSVGILYRAYVDPI
jgi:hypothetical protein